MCPPSYFEFILNRHQILDMCVYNETTLSILFSAGSSSMVAQLPIATVTMATSQNLAGQEFLQDVIEMYVIIAQCLSCVPS